MWQAMHGSMTGWYEIRVTGQQDGQRLFRLFCLLDRNGPGLQRPAVVAVTGLSKPVGTAFTDAEYQAVSAMGDEYRATSPRRIAQ
jgi:hypothetical protein